jgi:hypothetical protein
MVIPFRGATGARVINAEDTASYPSNNPALPAGMYKGDNGRLLGNKIL